MTMRTMRLRPTRLVAVTTAVVVALLLLAGIASVAAAESAEGPQWAMNVVSMPTHITAGAPRDEIQQLRVGATGGTYALSLKGKRTSAIAYDAPAAEVEAAMASVASVKVTEVAGSGHTYDITFEGFLEHDMPVELMRVDAGELVGGSATVTELARGAEAPELTITATNIGATATDGSTITLKDILPSWLKVKTVFGYDMYTADKPNAPVEIIGVLGGPFQGNFDMSCSSATVTCSYEKPVEPGDQLVMTVIVESEAGAPPGAVNVAEVSGGGATAASSETPMEPDAAPVTPGPVPGGSLAAVTSRVAGGHPDTITSFAMATEEVSSDAGGGPKDVRFDLPPGLVGSTVGMPKCIMQRAVREECPTDTIVGVASVAFNPNLGIPGTVVVLRPVYDIEPAAGEPAAFGFVVEEAPVRLDTSVLSDGDYGVRVTASDLSQKAEVLYTTVEIWGVPAEHEGPGSSEDKTSEEDHQIVQFGGPLAGASSVPLLTNPQQCATPLVASMAADVWDEPGVFRESGGLSMGTLTGCELVPFRSSFSFLPDTLEAGAPAGYTFNLNVPQQDTAETTATSSVKDVRLTLPEGVVVNPSAAWGLKACTSAEFYGPAHPSQQPAVLAECPRESQVGEVEVETPDLEHVLKGQVFLGSPECDPCTGQQAEEGKMVRLFVQLVGEGESGIVVKLAGHGEINQTTGQITTVFEETPQIPFNHMRFVLEGGPRAVLANPRRCGAMKTTGDLTPWSSELAAGEEGLVGDSTPTYEFEINQNCFGAQFNPSFTAGMPNIQAGEHGEFTLAFGRADDDEFFKQLTLRMPPGLLGTLAGVELCKEAQANTGTCGASSLIGSTQVLTGPGADPFLVQGGDVYLTEGYGGAPYGLSIVVPAVAGPYTLAGTTGQGTVVVRAQIYVDSHTAQLTVVSGELPSMLDGIPLQLRAVDVKIDRPGFTFNPTNCGKLQVTGTITAVEGATSDVSSPFQVTNCASLAFKPSFKAGASGRTSRLNGASLHVALSYPAGGGEANLRRVKVELPKQMPSRLSTLQKACTATQFAANPAGCPPSSIVGHAKASTPIIPVPLEGPAYFVSNGSAEWPNLVIVLQGYGTTVDLVGDTLINGKTDVTSSTFNTVPDVPVGSFELTLPEGPYSALTANANLCKAKSLTMPTEMLAQNGAVVDQSTKIQLAGCPKAKTAKHARKRAHRAKHRDSRQNVSHRRDRRAGRHRRD